MTINGNGNVGINTTDPKCRLQVMGVGNINGGSSFVINNYTFNNANNYVINTLKRWIIYNFMI